MSSGYRVKKTDLFVFKAMPIEIRREFFENPVSVNISRNPIDVTYDNADALSTPPAKQKKMSLMERFLACGGVLFAILS